MDWIVSIFYAVFLFGCGFLLVKYRRVIKSWTGNFVWAERYLGSGGTYFVLLVIGCFLMIWGVLYPFGGLELIFGTAGKDASEFHMR